MTKPTSQDRVHTIDGVQYTFRLSLRAWALLGEQWSLPDLQAAQEHAASFSKSLKVGELVDVFWAALQSHHPDISREDAFALADGAGFAKVTEIIGDVMAASNPPPDPAAKKKPPAAKND